MSSMNHQDYKDATNTCLFYSYHKLQVLNTGYIDTKYIIANKIKLLPN